MNGGIARLHCRLGATLAWWGWNWGAAQALRDAVGADPRCAEAYFGLGEALARRGEWSAASHAYREAARLRPADVEVQGSLALALGRAGRWDDAVQALRRLAHLRPLQAEVHVLVGAIQRLKLKRPAEAIRAYRWAIRLELGPAGTRFTLAEALLGAQAWEAAMNAFAAAKRLEPAAVPAAAAREPGQSVLHHHPGGPVAVPIANQARLLAPSGGLREAWRAFLKAVLARRRRLTRGVRLIARTAGEAERAPLLHCYKQSLPASGERPGRAAHKTARHAAPPAARRLA
jgi:tetratricopeptide (TPR) repeat protein